MLRVLVFGGLGLRVLVFGGLGFRAKSSFELQILHLQKGKPLGKFEAVPKPEKDNLGHVFPKGPRTQIIGF